MGVRINFDELKYQVIPKDTTCKKRDTLWVAVCQNCQCEREVTYCTAFNIAKKIHSNNCKKCLIELGLSNLNTEGLTLGRKKHFAKGFKNLGTVYQNIFDNPVNKPGVKLKQRNAKLGKYGKNANAWIDGRNKKNILLRNRDEYKQLRKLIFKKDNYTCQICKVRGDQLEMDHIKEWCNYPELRFEESNCRTLCVDCHKKTDNFGSKARKLKRV